MCIHSSICYAHLYTCTCIQSHAITHWFLHSCLSLIYLSLYINACVYIYIPHKYIYIRVITYMRGIGRTKLWTRTAATDHRAASGSGTLRKQRTCNGGEFREPNTPYAFMKEYPLNHSRDPYLWELYHPYHGHLVWTPNLDFVSTHDMSRHRTDPTRIQDGPIE